MLDFHVTIDRSVNAPATARRAIERLEDQVEPDVLADVKLLVSELVTNAYKYGGPGAIEVRVQADDRRHVEVEVHDDGESFVPGPRARPSSEPGGWGLHLVGVLSQRWGVRDGFANVWFEIDRRLNGNRVPTR